ncbi:MAG: NADH-quinone oxidoreductase subunit N [Nitrospiraceae bacterium]|nr:NADH-quinone oxidoreductase subunit N [Nitrospiraceae bacterium]
MNATDLTALLPILVLGGCCILTMLTIAIRRDHATITLLSGASCLLTLAALPLAAGAAPHAVTALLLIDGYALFFMGLLVSATLVVMALSHGYLRLRFDEHEDFEEFYLLLLLATLGGLVLVASVHLASFFLGLELIGVSLYSLIGYLRTRRGPLEAALKYLMLSASASAFLLFGMALMYFEIGTMAFREMGVRLAAEPQTPALWLAGFMLTLTGIGFKLGLVPFHLWIPDVYQGAPAPVTAFVATVSKGAVFAVLLRFVGELQALQLGRLGFLFGALSAASMFAGNFLALLQNNVKRLLAYSSIAHFGYLLVALLAGGAVAAEAVTFYLVAYFITTLGAFGIVTILSKEAGDAEALEDYRGLFWSHPWLAGSFMLMLLSLTGIPLTVGFVGKFYAIAAGVEGQLWFLVVLLVINSAISAYYYLRLILTLVEQPDQPAYQVSAWRPIGLEPGHRWTVMLSLGLVTAMLLGLGVYPGPLMEFIRAMLGPLVRSAMTVAS